MSSPCIDEQLNRIRQYTGSVDSSLDAMCIAKSQWFTGELQLLDRLKCIADTLSAGVPLDLISRLVGSGIEFYELREASVLFMGVKE